jgi:hypothetical protein
VHLVSLIGITRAGDGAALPGTSGHDVVVGVHVVVVAKASRRAPSGNVGQHHIGLFIREARAPVVPLHFSIIAGGRSGCGHTDILTVYEGYHVGADIAAAIGVVDVGGVVVIIFSLKCAMTNRILVKEHLDVVAGSAVGSERTPNPVAPSVAYTDDLHVAIVAVG